MKRSKFLVSILILILVILALLVANILWGSVSMSISEVIDAFSQKDSINHIIVVQKRIPQAICAATAGAALGVCGLMMQTLFRNPLADPSILGISSGATFAIAILTFCAGVLGFSSMIAPIWQILAALVGSGVVLVFLLSVARRLISNTALLIAGIMTGYLTSAFVSILQYSGSKDANFAFVMWSQGSFSSASLDSYFYIFLGFCVLSIGLTFFLIRTLNMLLLGENYARNLGLNIPQARTIIIILTSVLTGVVTAYCGPIAFVGLAVPHIVRSMSHTANRRTLIPLTILCGMILCLVCNLISKQPVFGYSLPINAITSLIGAPIVIYAVIKNSSYKKH